MNIPAAFTITTAAQSQKIDADTVDNFGIDGFTLMEIAGSSAARALLAEMPPHSRGVFLCGKGNNGGDALAVARYLAQHRMAITLVFISGTDDLSPAASKNYDLLTTIAENDTDADVNIIYNWADFDSSTESDFIVDGMLGTGLDSNLRGDYTEAVAWANNQSAPTYAMDIPTGLHADTGRVMGNAIQAAKTFAFGTLKMGFYLGNGHAQTGTIHFVELPFPNYIKSQSSTYLIDESWEPDRSSKPARHKYEAGVVYLIAGSEGLTGAAIMAAKSAWAQGVGAVILICPRGVLPIFENNLPQIIKKPVGTHNDFFFKKEHSKKISQIVNEKEGVVLLGPGLGREQSTVHFLTGFLGRSNKKIILDADGLWALSQQDTWQKPDQADWILTPHPGELATLLKSDLANDRDRLEKVKETATEKKITILSKGFPVILGAPDGTAYLSGYDTRVFSRAGFGDVLAGKIAAFKALGYESPASCITALLSGEKRAEPFIHKKNDPLEPLDLL